MSHISILLGLVVKRESLTPIALRRDGVDVEGDEIERSFQEHDNFLQTLVKSSHVGGQGASQRRYSRVPGQQTTWGC